MLPNEISALTQSLQKFDGLGFKSSQKLALDILELDPEDYANFLENIELVRKQVRLCSQCGFFASKNENQKDKCICEICANSSRNKFQICLLEKPTDVIAMEKSNVFRGQYQILKKLISPLENHFVEDTNLNYFLQKRLPNLVQELQQKQKLYPELEKIELILFFKTGFAAEATTAYLKEVLATKPWKKLIKISELAQGLPLYYNPQALDQATMTKAILDRKNIFN